MCIFVLCTVFLIGSIYAGSGDLKWRDPGVPVCRENYAIGYPEIAPDNHGGAIIVWEDIRNGHYHGGGYGYDPVWDNYDIYVQHVDENGYRIWGTDGIPICREAGKQKSPEIVSDGMGGAIIVWQDSRNGIVYDDRDFEYYNYDIYAQRIDAEGNILWEVDGIPICQAINDQIYPKIVSDGRGGAIIVWQDTRNDNPFVIIPDDWLRYENNNYDIYAQHIDAEGNLLWERDGIPICTVENRQGGTQVISDMMGGAIIVWDDDREYTSNESDIYAQRINADGDILWEINGRSICNAVKSQYFPDIVSDGACGAIILWTDDRIRDIGGIFTTNSVALFAQKINAGGEPQWGGGTPGRDDGIGIYYFPSRQISCELAPDRRGGFFLAWSEDYDYRSGKVYMLWVDALGHMGGRGVRVSLKDGQQREPRLLTNDSGEVVIVWRHRVFGTCGDCKPINSDEYRNRYHSFSHLFAQKGDRDMRIKWGRYGVDVAPTDGMEIEEECPLGEQLGHRIISDGRGNAIIAWWQHFSPYGRSSIGGIYAQKIQVDNQIKRFRGRTGDIAKVSGETKKKPQ